MTVTYSSIKGMLGKIHRDIKPTHPGWEDDAIEWSGEALSLIGAHPVYVQKQDLLKVYDHRAPIPKDCIEIKNIKYDPEIEVGFDSDIDDHLKDRIISSITKSGSPLRKGTSDFHPEEEDSDRRGDVYYTNGGWIITTFKEGCITVSYRAYATDTEGYPMIPENQSTKQAVLWYVVMMMTLGGYRLNNNKINFEVAERRWLKYCDQSRSSLNQPSEKEMESFKNSWTRLVPNVDADETFYESMSDKEVWSW